jgi:hypothetical protein
MDRETFSSKLQTSAETQLLLPLNASMLPMIPKARPKDQGIAPETKNTIMCSNSSSNHHDHHHWVFSSKTLPKQRILAHTSFFKRKSSIQLLHIHHITIYQITRMPI